MSKYRAYKGIPQKVFNEMRAITEQYDNWQEELRDTYGVRPIRLSDKPQGVSPGSATESTALRATQLKDWIREIHEAVQRSCPPEHQAHLLYSVTKNRGYTYMTMRKDWNISERDFRRYRSAYFRHLAKKRGRI